MNNLFTQENGAKMGKMLMALAFVAVLLVGMKFINEMKRFGSVGKGAEVHTIDVMGTGESFAIPDVATESFTVEQKGKTIAEAQGVITKKLDDVMAFLKDAGVDEKDIQTANYSAYPEYNYPAPCYTSICAQRSPTLIGYTVSQTVNVKIHDTEKVGEIIEGLGSRGVTGMSGPNFVVDEPEAVQAEARAKAINNAEMKAKALAKDLGVRLVRIVRFTEGGYGATPPMPYYAKDMVANQAEGMGAGGDGSSIPAGQNQFTSNVTITYEIR